MLKHLSVCWSAAFLAGGLLAGAIAAEPGAEARLETFSHPDGENFFALSFKPGAIKPAGPRDVVFLFDTSASQTSDFRTDALDALRSALAELAPNDRVKLLAVDLHAARLTEGFVAPDGREMAEALEKLDRRVPLGSTDMEKALVAAADSFADKTADRKHGRAVIYVGDGMSTANLLGTEKFQKLVDKLTGERIPVNSCLVGPRLDRQLLGALAGKTGGRIVEMGPDAGKELAAAADTTVLWPSEDVAWPTGIEVYPARVPPLRTDRDTVVIGAGSKKTPFRVRMKVSGPSGTRTLSWTVKPSKSSEDNNYLAELVHRAQIDDAASLPLIGSESLDQARRAINLGVRSASHLARLALAGGNLDHAECLAGEALHRDPGNPEALAIQGAVVRRRNQGGEAALPKPARIDLKGDAGNVDSRDGELAGLFGRQEKVIAQITQATVQNAINNARFQMARDPEGSKENLKLTLEMVRQTPDITPEFRDRLTGVIQAAVQAAGRRQIELEQRRRQRQEAIAASKERTLVSENLQRKQQKVRQLMERFNSLMDEGRYRLAEEAAAAEAAAEVPECPVPVLATLHARMSGYHHDAMLTRIARQKGVVDTLFQEEKAHVPVPDEPPVVYPESGIWQELSARRTEKYSSMDLASRNPVERKIVDALKSPTQFDFIATPLQDVGDFVGDLHDIEVQLDRRALSDVGIETDEPVTINVKGVSLRSAMRLMLHQLNLTYTIQDEVLLITTPEEVENRLTTQVFPVADLVIPIRDPDFMGGFGQLGNFGQSSGTFGSGNMQNNQPGSLFPGMNQNPGIFNIAPLVRQPRL